MIRVHVICEGQTEEMFVNQVMYEFFQPRNIQLIPSCVGKPGHKGGNVKYERVLKDVQARLLTERTAYCTTFFDFYGLPESFPGKKEAAEISDLAGKHDAVADGLMAKLIKPIGADPLRRFIPYVQMHEFEGLLFSEPQSIANELGSQHLNTLTSIREGFSSPEHINNNPSTAPSKRIISLYPGYDKVIAGSLIALETGFSKICDECRLFNQWVERLQSLEPIL